jgi:AGZA family xanthine/uracil permease-like MFS transporter
MGIGGHLVGWPIAVFCVGLLLMIVLVSRAVPGAVLISILVATVLAVVVNSVFHVQGWGLVSPNLPEHVVASPDFSLLGHIDLFGGFGSAGVTTAIVFLFTLVLSGFFDAMGTITSVSEEAGLTKDGRVEGMGRILLVDGIGAFTGGLTGSAPNTVFLESAAGVGEGARTGLASVVTGALFTATLFFTPIAAVVPAQAAAPALVVIGGMMMAQCRRIPWEDLDFAIPVFLTIALIPFTYSITNGIGAGLVAYVLIRVCKGKVREVGWLLGSLAVVFTAYFAIEGVTSWF